MVVNHRRANTAGNSNHSVWDYTASGRHHGVEQQ